MKRKFRLIKLACLLILLLTGCFPIPLRSFQGPGRQAGPPETTLLPALATTITPIPTNAPPQTSNRQTAPTPSVFPAPTRPQSVLAPTSHLDCQSSPQTLRLLEETSAENWLDWVEKLSGAQPVTIGGKTITLTSRYTPAIFNAETQTSAFDFVYETLQAWYPAQQVRAQPFQFEIAQGQRISAKNLEVTLPGTTHPEEVIILSAHLDSTARPAAEHVAPGADDNASGSAALIEAARIFSDHSFARTIRLVWFTGEEEGLWGSKAYVKELNHSEQILGVINLDMYGYDADNDHCFELHVGTLSASDRVGQCFIQSAESSNLGLHTFDYLTDQATSSSDHSSFWEQKIGAIEVLENFFDNPQPDGCAAADPNPNYHTPQDTADHLNPDFALRITRAAFATVVNMAIMLR